VGSVRFAVFGGCMYVILKKSEKAKNKKHRVIKYNLIKMKNFFILLVIFITSLSGVFAQTKIVMQKKGGVYTLPCKVNGLELTFIFDTGASKVCIFYRRDNTQKKRLGYV
jgi:hypothetical protein